MNLYTLKTCVSGTGFRFFSLIGLRSGYCRVGSAGTMGVKVRVEATGNLTLDCVQNKIQNVNRQPVGEC
jgi:hypothetical protein